MVFLGKVGKESWECSMNAIPPRGSTCILVGKGKNIGNLRPIQTSLFISFFFFFDSAVKYPSKLDFNLSYFQLTPQSDQYSMAHNHELCVLMRAVLVGGFI